MCCRDSYNSCSSQKSQSELPFVFVLYFLGGGKMKRLIGQRASASQAMEISFIDHIFALSAEDNVLSQKTTIHNVSLSEDDTTVIYGDDHHGVSRELQGAESFVAWGAVAFTSGRHYWEVDVTHSSNWILGVCKDILTSDTDIIIDSEEAFFLFSVKVNNHYSLSTNSPPLIQYVKRPLGRIGVFLDYDNGIVSFYDVCRGSLIYSFLPSSFSSPLMPFLCLRSP